ncbi:MAG: 60S ribosomal export protein NMD3 [Methanobacteriota archaeon]
MFCVECGREGPTTDGVCTTCFATKHRVVRASDHLDAARCRSCGAIRVGSAWMRVDLEDAIPLLLRETVPPLAPFEAVVFRHVAREEDANNVALDVTAVGRYGHLEQTDRVRTRLRLKPSLCDTCTKQKSRYFQGILQVRGEGRDLTPKEVRGVRTFVQARVDRARDSGEFVSRLEEIDGGLDFYVSSNALGKVLAREVAETFGGTTTMSPKLFGQRGGKEVYRVTCLVRLAPFRVGDVVRVRGAVFEVLRVAALVTIRDLVSGESRRFKSRDLRTARRVEAERFEATLARSESGEIVVDDPETGRTRGVATLDAAPGRAVVVWTSDAAYVSALPTDASKG